jgi:pimeloyl-ACP methyl ester carboxylesterase
MNKEHKFVFNNKSIYYNDKGSGSVIVLLHGYLESKEVWGDFYDILSHKHRVISIDIPGHGKSDVIDNIHSMDLMAQVINKLLSSLDIDKFSLIGHSMGGYITLSFAELYPEKLNSFILFHSSVYADNDEKRTNRQKDIELIDNEGLDSIVKSNIPKMFSNNNVSNFVNIINTIQQKALMFKPEGVTALLRGMMQRKDKQRFVSNFKNPMLFIFGEKDNYIPIEVAKNMTKLNSNIEYKTLKNSGHMGFIEETDESLKIINAFC